MVVYNEYTIRRKGRTKKYVVMYRYVPDESKAPVWVDVATRTTKRGAKILARNLSILGCSRGSVGTQV